MKIYFATHSTTKDNENEIASGWDEAELSELGIQQSKKLAGTFAGIKIDIICCSDLKRSLDTVKIAFRDRLPVIIDKRLRELNYGDFNGKPKSVVEKMKMERIKMPFPKGESYADAIKRVQDFFKELKERYPDVENILVIGHRATQYGLETLINGKTIEECLNTPFKWQPYWEYNF